MREDVFIHPQIAMSHRDIMDRLVCTLTQTTLLLDIQETSPKAQDSQL